MREGAIWISGPFVSGFSIGLALCPEPVADVPDGIDKRVGGIFYFASQPSNVHIDSPVPAKVVKSPHFVQKRIPFADAIPVGDEELEKLIFPEGEDDHAFADEHLTFGSIYLEFAAPYDFLALCTAAA